MKPNWKIRRLYKRISVLFLFLVLMQILAVPVFSEDKPFEERTALFEEDQFDLQKKIPIILSAELLATILSGLNQYDWGRYNSGGITAAFGVFLVAPNLDTEYFSSYQDLGLRIAGTATGVLLLVLSSYILTTDEKLPDTRIRNTFVGFQLALTPLFLKLLFLQIQE